MRAAIVMPIAFAGTTLLTHSSTAALFAAFGSIIMLLYIDLSGPIRQRLTTHASVVVGGLILIAIGTAVSPSVWIASTVTLVVTFVILFSGVISSVLAGTQTTLLISFMLPVTFPGPIGSTPDRLLGWLVAGAASFIAIAVILPGGTGEPLRSATGAACIALGRRLRGEAKVDDTTDATSANAEDTGDGDSDAVARLRQMFFDAPYRPSGLNASARILILVIEQIFLLENVLDRGDDGGDDDGDTPGTDEPVTTALEAAGDALICCGRALTSKQPDARAFDPYLARMRDARAALENATVATAPGGSIRHGAGSTVTDGAASDGSASDGVAVAPTAVLGALEPLFRAQETSLIAAAITTDVQHASAERQRSLRDKLVGREPAGVRTPVQAARLRARAQLDWRSVWLHNSIRGAVGFALTVVLADVTGVQHAFWVAFGALAVLRSSAANTGQSAIRAMIGTAIGIVLGSLLVSVIGDQSAITWVLLPIAILVTGIAPAISFTAGQAAFTVTLLVLFNIMGPSGWATGVIRIEDMAIGCGVSVLVALLLWPRGAAARFNQTLADALRASADYLTRAVNFALVRCEESTSSKPTPPTAAQRSADDASRRLDDVLRQFLAERGVKNIAQADLAPMVLAVGAVRRAADAICELWSRADPSSAGDRAAARAELLRAQDGIAAWYDQVAAALTGPTPLPPASGRADISSAGTDATAEGPNTDGAAAAGRLLSAVAADFGNDTAHASGTAIKLIWTHDHLEVVSRLEPIVLDSARILVRGKTKRLAWLLGVRRPISDRVAAVRQLSRRVAEGARVLSR